MAKDIWTTNIRGLISNLTALIHELSTRKPLIAIICETFLTPDVPDSALKVSGYDYFRRDRGSHGGGIIVYFLESLKIRRLRHLESTDHETIWFQALIGTHQLVGCGAYWPPSPNTNLTMHLQTAMDSTTYSRDSSILIAGDLNAHHSSFNHSSYTNASGASLQAFMLSNNLVQVVATPTRVTGSSASCLDVMITNFPEVLTFTQVLPGIGSSDHGIAIATLNVCIPEEADATYTAPNNAPLSFDCSHTALKTG